MRSSLSSRWRDVRAGTNPANFKFLLSKSDIEAERQTAAANLAHFPVNFAMAAYDSDSSNEDASDYAETNVLLGYATKEPTDDAVSHLGGHPTWLVPGSSPPEKFAKCKCCNGYMSLLLQLNGDLPKYFPDDERRLHIFCCRKKTCSRKPGSVRALREVKRYKIEVRGAKKTEQNIEPSSGASEDLGAKLFGVTSARQPSNKINPFSTSSPQNVPANPFASLPSTSTLASKPPQAPLTESETPSESFAQKLKISDPEAGASQSSTSEPWPAESVFPSPFPRYNLDAEYEILAPENIPSQPSTSSASKSPYDADDDPIGGADKDADMTLDKTFLRFASRLAQNPEQVLRYEFAGRPLLYSGADDVTPRFHLPHGKVGAVQGLPRCESCGSGRVFELQLVPGLIETLEGEEVGFDEGEGMEWGTIILGVCSKDCGVVDDIVFREEWVGVQWEERIARK